MSQVQVTPLQMMTVLTFEAQAQALGFASMQLKAQGCEDAAKFLEQAAAAVDARKTQMLDEWQRRIVVPTPKLVAP